MAFGARRKRCPSFGAYLTQDDRCVVVDCRDCDPLPIFLVEKRFFDTIRLGLEQISEPGIFGIQH
jgi:hypothetical protein